MQEETDESVDHHGTEEIGCTKTTSAIISNHDEPKLVIEPMDNVINCELRATPAGDIGRPDDIRELTIRNLDTGEEFIIGENDPDFEFDTFELRSGAVEEGPTESATKEGKAVDDDGRGETDSEKSGDSASVWTRIARYFFGGSSKAPNPKRGDISDEQSAPPFKMPFTKLSSFKFRRELGRGAFGRVLLAEAKVDGKLYALKIISKKNMRSSDKRQAKAERDILHAMSHIAPHPFTAGLKFAFQSENNLYLGMDYFPGGNLRELIKAHGCLPEEWVRQFSAELILAISHLHSLNVIYRDIKPHNVMLDSRGHVILIDFGLSKQEISDPKGAMSLVGTPDYSAPEVLKTGVHQIEQYNKQKAGKGKGKGVGAQKSSKSSANVGYGKAADWWSLGVMMYEMLAGLPAFRGADLRETYQRVLFADLEFKPEEKFSPAARQLLSGMMRRDPTLRLGAWDTPPLDIMNTAFFAGVNWDEVYSRANDGPCLPGSSSMKLDKVAEANKKWKDAQKAEKVGGGAADQSSPRDNEADDSLTPEGGVGTDGGGMGAVTFAAGTGGGEGAGTAATTQDSSTPAEEDEYKDFASVAPAASRPSSTSNPRPASTETKRPESGKSGSPSTPSSSSAKTVAPTPTSTPSPAVGVTSTKTVAAKEDEQEDNEEIMPLRDSVFINAKHPNALPGWSFMDPTALAEIAAMDAASDNPTLGSVKGK